MTLKDEIHANPACADALAARDCAALAAIVSIGRTERVKVLIEDVQSYLQGQGIWWQIKAIARNPDHPAFVAADAVMDVADARYTFLDMALPIIDQMFGGLVAAGAMTQEHVDAIVAMSVVPAPVTAQQVAEAVFNTDGSLK